MNTPNENIELLVRILQTVKLVQDSIKAIRERSEEISTSAWKYSKEGRFVADGLCGHLRLGHTLLTSRKLMCTRAVGMLEAI